MLFDYVVKGDRPFGLERAIDHLYPQASHFLTNSKRAIGKAGKHNSETIP
jgi:hypothetical protein